MRIVAGAVALAAIGLLLGGAFLGLASRAWLEPSGAWGAFDIYLLRIARFTLWQAGLSTLLSVVPAILVARAFARHPRFPGRALLLRLFAVPLGIPAIVGALGILALYGRAGLFASLTASVRGGEWPGIYGFSGILVAHVFFNLPLASRLFLEALDTVPDDQWRLASQLGMPPGAVFRLLEWPVLRASLPGVAGLVFMLCITSFTIVLMLGGGPGATTLEVAIYQALRFDFDPARAVALTAVQVALTGIVLAMLARLGAEVAGDANLPVASARPEDAGTAEKIANFIVIALAAAFVAGPLLATAIAGLRAEILSLMAESAVMRATATSLVLASAAAAVAAALALALTVARRALELRGARGPLERFLDTGAGFVLVVPPLLIGAGWFVLLQRVADPFRFAPAMVIAANAVTAMPFALRAIRPAYDAGSERHERLCASLGIAGFTRFRLIDWPVLKRPLFTALAFAMALSLGDLGVIALFGSDAVQTLPYLLLARMGSYRTEDAAGIALLLGLLCFGLMLAADRLGQRNRR